MQIKCIHCENGIRKNPNLGYAHVLPSGEVVGCPFETREYRRGLMKAHLTKHAPDVVESVASRDILPASEVSASEAESTPATTQVM